MTVWRKHSHGSTERMSDCQTVRQRGDFTSRWFYDGGYMLLHVCQAQMEANAGNLLWIQGQKSLYSTMEATSLGYSARPHHKTKARIQCVNTERIVLWWAVAFGQAHRVHAGSRAVINTLEWVSPMMHRKLRPCSCLCYGHWRGKGSGRVGILCVFHFAHFFQDRVLLCTSSWPVMRIPLAFSSPVLRSQAWATTKLFLNYSEHKNC